ncbi:MAG: hypothetical protein WC891_02975 [Actinomycetota bacterium]
MADPTYQPKVYRTNNGDRQVIASGGELKVETGGKVVPNSGTQASHVADASVAHALNVTFSDTEVEAALNALGTNINFILAALEGAGILASS